MDGSRFDALTRALGTSTSRRAAIKSLLGLGGALVAGNRLGLDGAEAARRGYSGPTFPTVTPGPTEPSCPSGQTWNGEACVCSAGITCGSNCCGDGQDCTNGGCVTPPPTCPAGQVWNGVACVCTAGPDCGSTCCTIGQTCSDGSCVTLPPTCPNGQTWDGFFCSCTSGQTCGAACCDDQHSCLNSVCVRLCPAPGQFWNGSICACPSGIITCNLTCCNPSTTMCINGNCVSNGPTCAQGQFWDGSTCACNVGAACWDACCNAEQTCMLGVCLEPPPPPTCPAGQTPQGDTCVCTTGVTCGARCCTGANQSCSHSDSACVNINGQRDNGEPCTDSYQCGTFYCAGGVCASPSGGGGHTSQ